MGLAAAVAWQTSAAVATHGNRDGHNSVGHAADSGPFSTLTFAE